MKMITKYFMEWHQGADKGAIRVITADGSKFLFGQLEAGEFSAIAQILKESPTFTDGLLISTAWESPADLPSSTFANVD